MDTIKKISSWFAIAFVILSLAIFVAAELIPVKLLFPELLAKVQSSLRLSAESNPSIAQMSLAGLSPASYVRAGNLNNLTPAILVLRTLAQLLCGVLAIVTMSSRQDRKLKMRKAAICLTCAIATQGWPCILTFLEAFNIVG